MKYRRLLFAAIAGLGTGFCVVAGKSLDVEYSLDLFDKSFYISWLIYAVILGVVIHVSWELCGGAIVLPKVLKNSWIKLVEKVAGFEEKITFPIAMGIIFLLWIPAWLSIFPGVFSYDAYDEWMQVYTGNITAHHPVLHVLFLGGIVEAANQLLGSYNLGIALCTVIQMLVLSATFAYTIDFMKEQKVNPLLRLFAIVFYGCSPVVQLFAICGTKDVFYGAAFLLFVISIYRICTEKEQFFQRRQWMILFGISSLFTMIMRNNGKYIVLLTLVLVAFVCRKQLKKYLVMSGAVLALYLLYVGPFYSALDVTAGGVEEMLSVPLQQIARVYHYEQNAFSEEELNYLHALVPQENWEAYRSTVSDFVKSGFREEVFEEDPMKFLALWAQTGMEHPLTYMNSFLVNTVDFWYPFAVVDGYQDVYGKSSYFDYRVSEPGTENVIFSALHERFDYISHDVQAQKDLGMFLFLSPGWYLILFLLLSLYVWREKKYDSLLTLFPILLNFGTVLLGPIALVRYVLILFYAFPIYCVMVKK